MSSLKVRKALVKVIGFGSVPEKLRVILYNFCFSDYGFREDNLETKYIPEDLRFPNSEFMLVWEYNSWRLIEVERLESEKLILTKRIIEKHLESLDYLDIKEYQEIEQDYSHLIRDFFACIVGIDYKYGIVSDKSCLDYFAIAFGESLASYKDKIKFYYNIDASDLINCSILDIMKSINN